MDSFSSGVAAIIMVTRVFYHLNYKNYDANSGDRSPFPVDESFIVIFLSDSENITNEYRVEFIEKVIRSPDRVPSFVGGWSIAFAAPSIRFSSNNIPFKQRSISECFELIKRDYPEDFLALSFHHEVFNGKFFLTRGEQ
jgi:hypothetical protein